MLRSLTTLAALGCALCVHAAVPPAEQILPDDTLVMFTIPDCAKTRAVSAHSPMWQLWNDSAMKPFKDKFLHKLNEELVQPLERELGVKFEDYAALAQGQFTLALTANGWRGEKGTEPSSVLLLDVRDNEGDLKKTLEDFRKKWTEAGKTVRSEKVRGLDFLAVTLTTNDIPDALKRILPGPSGVRELGDEEDGDEADESKEVEAKSPIFFGQVGSSFVAGNNLAGLERVVARLTGGDAPVLADVVHFQNCQPVFFREAHAFGWVNAKRLMSALGKVSEREEAASEVAPDPFAKLRPEKILDAAGLNGVRSVAFAIQDSAEGAMVQFHVAVPESERKGLLKIMAGEPKETTPPPFVPADAVKFTRWRMDGQKTWSTLTSALNDISPTIMSTVDYILNTANEAGQLKDDKFDLRRQMIGNLGDDLISFTKKPRGTDPEQMANPPSLMLVGSKAPEEMAAAMKVMFGALSRTGKADEREFLGRTIYSVTSMAGPQLDPTNVKHRKMHLSHSGSYVLIANDEAVLEEYLRGAESPVKPLREVPGVLEAIQKVSDAGTSLVVFENQQETQRVLYETMKTTFAEADKGEEVSGMTPIPETFGMAMPQQSIKAWFDYSLLPPFDDVAKYYGYVVFAGSANVDGLTLKVFTPTPVGLRQ